MNQTRTQQTEIDIQNQIANNISYLEFLHAHRTTLESLEVKFSFFSSHIDFDQLDRPDMLRVFKAFPGKWVKSKSFDGDRIHYTLDTPVSGLTVRIWNGEPPAACVIEERTEWVDVPARREKRVIRTIKCPELTSTASPS